MTAVDPKTITRLLHEARGGNAEAAGALLPLVYGELQALAQGYFSRERRGHTLQPTALIHEAWIKLAGELEGTDDRREFFACAARAMRQVLIDHARTARRDKRGSGARRVTLEGELVAEDAPAMDLVDLDDTLQRLAALNERHARMVELRLFGGLTIPETAQTLGVSTATVERDWFTVRAWLRRELGRAG